MPTAPTPSPSTMSNNDIEFLRSEAYRYFKLVLLVLYMYIHVHICTIMRVLSRCQRRLRHLMMGAASVVAPEPEPERDESLVRIMI